MKMFVKKRPTVVEDAVPATVEQAIPISDVYEDGICLVGRNLWSKTFKFSDINYATASKGDKENMFFAYSAILNSFDTGAMTKITINNRRMNQSKFEKESIMVNRGELLNGNSFITGVSGSGKSLLAKQEIINLFLSDKVN